MNINIIDILFFIITALIIFDGVRRGLVISIINLVRTVLGIPISFFVARSCNEQIYNGYVKQRLLDSINEQLSQNGGVDKLVADIRQSVSDLPDFISQAVDISKLQTLSNEKAVAYIESELARPVALVIIEIVVFLVVLIAIAIITGVLVHIIKAAQDKDKSILGKTNKLLGGAFGFVKALVFIYAMCTLAGLLLSVMPNSENEFVNQLNTSFVIDLVNKVNPFIK